MALFLLVNDTHTFQFIDYMELKPAIKLTFWGAIMPMFLLKERRLSSFLRLRFEVEEKDYLFNRLVPCKYLKFFGFRFPNVRMTFLSHFSVTPS